MKKKEKRDFVAHKGEIENRISKLNQKVDKDWIVVTSHLIEAIEGDMVQHKRNPICLEHSTSLYLVHQND